MINHPSSDEFTPLTSLVFRLTKKNKDAVKALAKRTRVIQSHLLREAVADLLKKYEGKKP